MPGLNQAGPQRQSSITGRRMGRCTNYSASLKNHNANPSDNQTGDQPENLSGKGFRIGLERVGRGQDMGR